MGGSIFVLVKELIGYSIREEHFFSVLNLIMKLGLFRGLFQMIAGWGEQFCLSKKIARVESMLSWLRNC